MTATLTWGNPHSLTLGESSNGVDAVLTIIKAHGEQSLALHLPPQIRLDTIQKAWRDQGEKWEELEVEDRPPKKFSALRVIWLPDGWCLQWNVLHIQDRPFDSFSCTKLTKEIWKSTF